MAKDESEEAPHIPNREPRMRIRLLDNNLGLLSDRLVNQSLTTSKPPQETHEGPFCVEVTLRHKEDVERFVEWVKQLSGILPIEKKEKGKRGRKKKEVIDSDKVEEYYEAFKTDNVPGATQNQLIEELRSSGYKFLTTQFIQDFEIPIEIKEKHLDYQWMLRQTKEAKDPKNDKYDPQLVFGFKLVGDKVNNVKVYLYGKFHESLKVKWDEKSETNLKALRFMRFPEWMEADERIKFSIEHRKLEKNPELTPSKFYDRRKKWVKNL